MKLDRCTFADGESPLKESANIELENSSFQWKYPLWYSNRIVLENCHLLNTDLAFEYCSGVDARIESEVDSVKNPYDGLITAKSIGEVIFDDSEVDRLKTTIVVAE